MSRSFGPYSPSYRSPQFGAMRGEPLTDERIFRYMLAGHYGAARQRAAVVELRLRQMSKKAETQRTKAETKAVEETLSFLGLD